MTKHHERVKHEVGDFLDEMQPAFLTVLAGRLNDLRRFLHDFLADLGNSPGEQRRDVRAIRAWIFLARANRRGQGVHDRRFGHGERRLQIGAIEIRMRSYE